MSSGRNIACDKEACYPRLCAHRGFNIVAPENSMPAYGAAVALLPSISSINI